MNRDFKFYIPTSLKNTIGYMDFCWLEELSLKFEYLRNKVGFIPLGIEDSSRFGLVVYGIFNGVECVIKIVPSGKKSENELLFWQNNNYSFMVPLFYIDFEEHIYIIKKGYILPKENDMCVRFNNVKSIFEKVISTYSPIDNSVESYGCKLKERYQKLKENDVICRWLELAVGRYEAIEKIYDSELLHGDLRYSNIVSLDGKILSAIDPLGVNAPKLMEFTRYIEDEIFECVGFEEFNNKITMLLNLFSDLGLIKKDLLNAVFVDSILRTSSSIILRESDDIISKGINNAVWLNELLKGDICETYKCRLQ